MWPFEGKGVWLLYDPDRLSPEDFMERLERFRETLRPSAVLVGTSFLEGNICERVRILKGTTDLPVILFPGSHYQLCPFYDYVLFLSLLSGRNPEYLIGEHVKAAPQIKRLGLKVIPVAYLLIDGGTYTATEFVSNTKPIPRDKPELILAHVLAARYLGFAAVYLEAGSGAVLSVPTDTVTKVKEEVGLPVIVGGGIRSLQEVDEYHGAGADVVVIGTAVEDGNLKGT
ncbi:MAG: geranylgeranylglyceryl/heptaprenylglyceryl phosphate synthase [Thermotogae bacterium]|nr:geranylgeranylglyceryl/heptaprenylglyceryl phosphate synthase [Thermotogota bacterium]